MDKKLLLQLLGLFIITQAIGLFVAYNLIGGIASGEIPQPTFITEDPDDIVNAVGLIIYILFGTVIFLLMLKYAKGARVFRFFEAFIVFITAWIVFEFVFTVPFPEIAGLLGLVFALALLAAKIIWRKSILLRNISSVIAVSAVGALVGVTLGILPVLIFIVLLAVYDYIAVFKTKHMVSLAKGIQGKNLAFTFAMPTPKHTFELGTGDFVIPLAFATSAMRNSSALGFPDYFIIALFVLAGSLIGLLLTMEYLSKRVGMALPALPLQTAVMIIAFAIGSLLGY